MVQYFGVLAREQILDVAKVIFVSHFCYSSRAVADCIYTVVPCLCAVLFGKWTDHVKSWRHTELGDRIMYITYEEMCQVTLTVELLCDSNINAAGLNAYLLTCFHPPLSALQYFNIALSV